MNGSNRKIKVMQITHDLRIGGLQRVVLDLCKHLDKNRFEVSVCCLRRKGELEKEINDLGIKTILIPQKKSGTDYFSFLKLCRVLKSEKPDIIHLHNSQPLIDGTIAALLDSRPKIVYTDHARNFPDKKRIMFIERFLSKFVDQIVGVSDHTVGNLIRYEGMNPRRIITVMNGIEEDKYRVCINKESKKEALGIKNFAPVIGLGVRLSAQKGITYLLKSAPEIIKLYPDLLILIVGEGELRNDLEDEARGLRIFGNVKFLGPRLDIPEILTILDVYVLPSLWEGLPLVLLEAMAAGKPIVATRVGGTPSVIEDGVSGILVEPQRPDLLAGAILKILGNEEYAKRLAGNGYDRFQRFFRVETMVRNYQELYERLMKDE